MVFPEDGPGTSGTKRPRPEPYRLYPQSRAGAERTVFSCITGSNCCYMVVFHYGSIVLFNAREHEVDDYLKIVKRHASITEMLPEMKRYEYEVREKPDSNKLMEAGLDYLMLQFLNIDGIQTIGSVLGRSIALDYYGCQVDGIVAECTDIKREMEKTGTYSIGKATSNVGDVRFKLGLLRLDTAEDKYFELWEYLRDEFELTQRFASLDFKLKFVEGEMLVMLRKKLEQQKEGTSEETLRD